MAAPDSLNTLRQVFEDFLREACALISGDDRLFVVLKALWVHIEGSLGPGGGSFSLETESRPRPILMTPAERRVAALRTADAAVEQLQAHPAGPDLLPPPNGRSADFEEASYLRKTFLVGFLKRYLAVAKRATYERSAFEETFAALSAILNDRRVEERVLIPLVGLTWSCEGDAIPLSQETRVRRVTVADREAMLNAVTDPVLGASRVPDGQSVLWVHAAVDARWRIPLHAPRLSQDRFEEAFDAVAALRLSAPGMISAHGCYASSPFLEWHTTSTTYTPLPFRAMSGFEAYDLTEERRESMRETFYSLRKLGPADRKGIGLAVDRFHRSFDVRQVEERVVDLIIALDSLVGSKGPASVHTVSVRLPLYVSESGPARLRLSRLVREAYRLRSVIVHGGSATPAPGGEFAHMTPAAFLTELEAATREALRRAIRDAGSGTRLVAEIPKYIDEELILGGGAQGDDAH